jgi:hypothetical protein
MRKYFPSIFNSGIVLFAVPCADFNFIKKIKILQIDKSNSLPMNIQSDAL